MTMEMKLNDEPFEQIRRGEKTVELRLYDDKRQKLRVGDTIRFVSVSAPERVLTVRVTSLERAPSFESLFRTDALQKSGFGTLTSGEAAAAMRRFYPAEDEARCGVLGIGFVLC